MYINRSIKNVFSEARLRFFGYAMAHRLTVYEGPQVALMVLTAKEIADGGVESSELTGLINEVMKLRSIDCGILVREETTCAGSRVRLSLRSKERYDVNLLASEMFGGGGHKRAAGATSTVTLAETVKIVKQRLNLEDR
jgi:phosphoesterase RecJ-like protein